MDHFRAGRRPDAAVVIVTTVVAAQILAVATCGLGLWAGLPLWAAAPLALVVGAATFLRIGGRAVVVWALTAGRYVVSRRRDIGRGTDFHCSGETVGVRWIGGELLAVVELVPPTRGGWSRLDRDTCDAPERVPLASLARCLEQNDVVLSGIDVVGHGRRSAAGTPAADVYDALIGPLPAAARRTVWVVVRFDPSANHASVARRGGGVDGAARTVAVAARRVVRTLADGGCPARILSAAEIESACARICRGIHPDTMSREWDHVPLAGAFDVGNAVDPRHVSRALLTSLWSVPSLATTVSVRLRPGRTGNDVRVGVSFRRTTHAAATPLTLPGLISAQGTHRDSLLAHLPVSAAELDVLTPFGEIATERLDSLCLPATGCGQLVGSSADGSAVTARVSGPGITDVHIAGEHYLAQQVVFRAVATGARVLVLTDRPHTWTTLVDAVGAPTRLRLGAQSSWTETGFDTLVVDGVPVPPPRAGVTTVHVRHEPGSLPRSAPTVSIVQPGACGDHVVLTAGDRQFDLALVTVPSESAIIGRPVAASARPAPVR